MFVNFLFIRNPFELWELIESTVSDRSRPKFVMENILGDGTEDQRQVCNHNLEVK